jgi:serine/threonine protein kinase/uncharacterized protein
MQVNTESHIYTDPVSEAFCPKCGEALSVEGLPAFTNVECPKCTHQFQVPARFGPFLLIELLGAGGMGGVYRAKDEALNREVAIKVMLQSLGDDVDFVETFQREAQAAAQLNNPHIAQIYSFGQQYGQPYIVMELVPHGSLEQLMIDRDGVEPAVAITIGAQIAEGLKEASDAGLVHGDVKPENILFDDEGNAKLVDFGLVALSSGNANEVWGTPFYIAPEKVRRQKSDHRSDIYSLGATIYHAITNRPPFDGPDATAVVKARFEAPPKPLSEVTGLEIPAEVEALIQRMLETDPAKRYPTYGSLLSDMKRYLSKTAPVSLKKSSRRIMIKGKPAVTFDRHSTQRTVTGQIAPDDPDVAELQGEDEENLQEQGCRKMVIGLIIFLLGLVALGGVIFAAIHVNRKKSAEREMVALVDRQQKVIEAGLKAIDVAGRNAAKIRKFEPEAMLYADEAARVAATVLGEDVRARMVPPEPVVNIAAAAADHSAASLGTTNQTKISSNRVEQATLPPGASDSSASADERVSVDFPEGEMPRDDDHPVVKTVRSMYMDAYAVKIAGVIADQVVAELKNRQQKLEKLQQSTPAGDRDALSAAYKQMVALYETMKNKVSGMAYIDEIKNVPNLTANLKISRNSVMTDLETLEQQRRLKKAEQERLARKAAEDARREAEKEVAKQKVLSERTRIAAVEQECVESIVNFRFSVAIRTLNALNDEIETDKGRLALMTAKDRVNRIEEFHKYIIEHAKGYKSVRGWGVSDANDRWLVVGNSRIFWKDFYTEQYTEAAELIASNVTNPAVKESMRIREYTHLMANAALFLNAFYPDKPAAQRFAKKLANDAAEQFSVEADIIKSLVPQYFE